MNDLNEMDQDTLMQLLALNQASESDDDFDEENFDFAEDDDDGDDDESFVESDDDDDFESAEWEEDYPVFADSADLSERRRRRRRRRSFRKRRYKRARAPKLRTVKGSKSTTLRSANGQRMRVRFGKSYATTVEVNKLIKSTEAKFAAAMKERKANHSLLTKQIASATSNIDGKIATVNKKVKSLEGKAQTSSLMGLLSGPPKIKSITIDGVVKSADSKIEFEPADMTLPLIMGMAGDSSGGDNNMMMMALLMSQNK